ncbi:N-acetylmuramoyl-L-alanine amidase [Sphingobacterium sp. N143]|uniref:N-acetylmuramoyl-L-alanine amidase n=1 Tax=Sphingobacterium sp. N143 TaxID=2746727 RepID=UPI0025754E54|nr:N-acetylmuramoyl-L-alanine amidase [Sphingobacterium sp. N143]MDM1294463.1 N-acetylmuramoyl-L-alanine amidase [Sphingobacterium sp. N143]
MEISAHRLVGVSYQETPNKKGTIRPIYIIMHYDEASNATSAISWMLDTKSNVSAHIHISREGTVTQLAPFNAKCWHAGISFWKGLRDLNKYSIGIELQNKGTEFYTEKQIESAVEVCKTIIAHYPIKEILGHSDIAPGRKEDPGTRFPWMKFKPLTKRDDNGTT